ncbi:SusD/RagB family nutrient-binding outer membrane lipoprotein [Prevotella melaninogenica]|uniref:RagB/SusD family nutrient uptake outer membrane protein n=1 Tax=Prevotella melaninogenica TaxID=28132 RepID=UPI001BA53387|nr:RagB/SusD family nutrient uptake outer membrane protein [Prevotella melaninogenica]MBW4730043.1 SusD/RagB family nutrient-binding outer membrane lipoprotein [Prevotella melaninogenica]MBW4732697.1 SusD/RagB family nutrient-binding outer membrane lipoprotein [Prevotella melaninogenica]MBW4750809.1 SusD/RagB family nutrient-binding outer membrane lipoprotein [Prevotella melaninogenica]QUB69655.1 SusD/RagB family nutrient-binding outer membrane lipoprotein [Prevotella melaninogenica]
MKTKAYKYIVGFLALSLFTACDFQKVNTNEFELLPEEGLMDGISIGGPITAMQKCVFPVGTQADGTSVANRYQTAYNLAADCWSGYFGQNNNWGGPNNLNYFLKDGWVASSYTESYSTVVPLWQDLKGKTETQFPEVFALAQILKISAWHKATDMFGPIPYKEAGKGLITVPYDSQEEVYKSMFKELSDAIEVLTKYADNGNSKLLPNADAVYAGDVHKWVVYANSLMLRLAMRVYYADAALSKKYALQAVNHSYGVMKTKDDEAKMERGASLEFKNNLDVLINQYNECRMGSSMLAYLGGYQDPRLPKYFNTSTVSQAVTVGTYGKYSGVPTGHDVSSNDAFKDSSRPAITSTTPTYWMRASEVYFLLAEAALHGFAVGGTAESLYEKGIEMSFEENGIASSEVADYMSSGLKPSAYSFHLTNPGVNVDVPAVTEATTAWSGTDEEKLEKIMIQKWIALYPNGQEAWTEYRRTGYPKLHSAISNYSNGEVDSEVGIRRMRFPTNKSTSAEDIANLESARKLLRGGLDKAGTRLWWDNKNH